MAGSAPLHEAMVEVLSDARRPLTPREVADAIRARGLVALREGQELPDSQVSARVRSYPELFVVVGERVWLTSGAESDAAEHPDAPARGPRFAEASESSGIEAWVRADASYRAAGRIGPLVPDEPGLYAIRVTAEDVLPSPFREELRRRGDRLIYIGAAPTGLRVRLLRQELRGFGTFFRSLGAVLGFRPASGSLVGKPTPYSFSFVPADEQAIIDWIARHLEIAWMPFDLAQVRDIDRAESALLRTHAPLLNLAGNPRPMPELRHVRAACVRVGLTA